MNAFRVFRAAAPAAGRGAGVPRAPAESKPRAPSFLDTSFPSLGFVPEAHWVAPLAEIAAGKGFEKTVTSGTYSGYSHAYSSYSCSDNSAKLVQGAVVQLLKDGRVVQSYASMAAWAGAAKKNPFSL